MTLDVPLAPRPRAIQEAFALAVALVGHPELPDSPTQAIPPDLMAWDPRAPDRLHRDLAGYLRREPDEVRALSGSMLRISRSTVIRVAGEDGRARERAYSRRAAMLLAGELAARLGLVMPPAAWPELERLLRQPTVPLQRLEAVVANTLEERSDRPTVVVLTPLSQVRTDEEHAQLMATAEQVAEMLERFGLRVVVPGRLLSPDKDTDWTPERLYDSERRLLLDADEVVLIVGPHDSWGAAQAISWCEANGAAITVFTTQYTSLSRVLGGGPFDTVVRPEDDPDRVAEVVAGAVEQRIATLLAHAQDARATQRRVRGPLRRAREALRRSLQMRDLTGVSARRAWAALSSGLELDSLTVREVRALRAQIGAPFDDLIDAALERDGDGVGLDGSSLDALEFVVDREQLPVKQVFALLRDHAAAQRIPQEAGGRTVFYRRTMTPGAWLRLLRERG